MNTTSPLVKKKPKYWQPFFIALAMSIVVFAPFVIMDKGYFLFYGDFNVQQIPFYQMCHDAVREGNIFWNWTTDLGVNFIGSYSFYLLGSPFFWLTIPFPSHAVPYLMAPLFCLKFACAALTSYAFIRRFTKHNEPAIIGGLLYAFSGFSLVNVFFNHFHEPMIFFPLLLIAVEELMENRRIGLFAFMVALNCIVNYFFFASMVTFTIIYFVIRSLSGGWGFKIGKFVQLVIEAVLGVLLAMFILLPSLLSVLQNPRVENMYYGYSALFYGYEQRYGQIIYSLFFPPDLPARNNFFTGSETKWASVSAWLPLFGATGVIAFMKSNTGHWAKRMFITCSVMALIPLLNSTFFMLNSAYYGRWFFMIVLVMCMMTACSLEDDKANWNSGILWSIGIVAAISLFIGLYPQKVEESSEYPNGIKYGMYNEFWNYIVWVAIAIGLILFTLLLIKVVKKNSRNRKSFTRTTLICTCFVCVIWSIVYIGFGKTTFNHNHESFMIPYCLNQGREISLPDQADENYRIDVLDGENTGYDNQGMFWQMRSIQSFHSIIPGSTMEFYPSVGVPRDVGTRPEPNLYELRSLLSVRWLFNYQDDEIDPAMPGYTYYGRQNGYYISENDNFIPMGFTYDYYITEEDYYSQDDKNRAALLLKAVLLRDEDIPKYEGILQHLDMDTVSYDYDTFVLDCQRRNEQTADYIRTDNFGFDTKITLAQDELVFFSVPYEKGMLYEIDLLNKLGISNMDGWTCTVDGQSVNIDKVNVGFMGIKLTAGEHTIRFNYRTPGLFLGIAITLGALLLFVIYFVIMLLVKRSIKKKEALEAITSRVNDTEVSFDESADSSQTNAVDLSDTLDNISDKTDVLSSGNENHLSSDNSDNKDDEYGLDGIAEDANDILVGGFTTESLASDQDFISTRGRIDTDFDLDISQYLSYLDESEDDGDITEKTQTNGIESESLLEPENNISKDDPELHDDLYKDFDFLNAPVDDLIKRLKLGYFSKDKSNNTPKDTGEQNSQD